MKGILVFLAIITATLSLSAQRYQEQLKAIHSNVIEQQEGKSYYIHTVKKGQTLYMISKSYGVEVNEIISGNPIVKEGLKAGQVLRIPAPVLKKEETPKKTAPSSAKEKEIKKVKSDSASVFTEPPVEQAAIPCGADTSTMHKQYKVALMLPLYLEEVESIDPENATEEVIDNWNSLKFLPYYEGFMLAVDSLQKLGLHLTLYVYDVGKDTVKTQLLLKKPELKTVNLIFGLLFHRNFQMVAKFAHENRIPIVNAISERGEILRDNEMVFKVNPSRNSQLECLADYMQRSMYRGQIIILRNGQYKDRDIADRLRKECQQKNLNTILAESQDVAIGKLSKSKENVIVAFADNNVYALDLMRRLYELRTDYTISLVGLPDWEKMEGLETDFLNGLSTNLVSPYFTDYSNIHVKGLVSRFQSTYKADPDQLAFQGFDQGYYFLSALMKFGNKLPACIKDFVLPTSQTSFEFIRSGNNSGNGFENRHWTVYKYENYRLIKTD